MLPRGGVAAAALASLALALAPATSIPAAAAGVPTLDHVFVIVMENHSYDEIIGSAAAPYVNSLAAVGGLATGYYAVTHPSLPNYLALAGGSTFGITSDCTTCWVAAPNIADRLEAAGRSWRTYQESMPSPCFVGDSSPYAQKHNPFIYFNNIRTNAARCQSHIVPYTQLASDLASTATTPNFAFITPNMCHDMHDCAVATGDAWLAQNVPSILKSPAFTGQRSLLALVWDEDDSSAGNHIPLVLVGSGVTRGYRISTTYNHYSLLRTLELALGLPSLTANDAGAATMADFFGLAGWSDLGGVATSVPDGTSSAAMSSDVFVRGTDNALWHRSWNGVQWGTWQSLGGVVTADPGVTSQGVQTTAFVRGLDHQVWAVDSRAGVIGGWRPLGGVITSGIDADSWTSGTVHIDVFARGTDNGLWHRWSDNGIWYSWESLGGTVTSDPGAVSMAPNTVDVFIRGSDRQLWHRSYAGGAWSGWEGLGGVLMSAPDAASCVTGHLDVVVVGTDGQVWRRGYSPSGWTSWQPLGGQGVSGISAACAPGATNLQLFAKAPGGAVIETTTAAS